MNEIKKYYRSHKWSEEDVEYFKKHYCNTKNDDLRKQFPSGIIRSKSSIEKKSARLGLKKLRNIYNEEAPDEAILTAIKQRGYTELELQRKFKVDFKYVKKIAKQEEDYVLYFQRNKWREKVVCFVKESKEKIEIEPRAYRYSLQPNEQPYLWINLPNIKFDKIKIVPLGDFHYGHKSCDVQTLKQDIEYIANNENVYCFLGRDLIENASKLSIAGGVYEQSKMPNQQRKDIVELLAPIAHKILWSISGNHEDRTFKHVGIDVGQWIAENLKVPYFREPIYVDIMWKGYRWTVFDQHGSTNSQTKGGKLNAAAKPIQWIEHTDFVIMHHIHDKQNNEVTRIVRNTKDFKLEEMKQYVMVQGAYLRYFGTYGAVKGYAPPTRGRMVMKLYSNGNKYLGN